MWLSPKTFRFWLWMSPLSGVTHFSAVLFVITINNVFTCSPRHTVLLSRPQLWTNNHGIHTTEYVIKHRYSHYISLVNVQISTSFNNWSNISVRQGCACKWTVPRDFTNTSQWRCHNWRCETWGMKEFKYYAQELSVHEMYEIPLPAVAQLFWHCPPCLL
jgi:hypothetical protein